MESLNITKVSIALGVAGIIGGAFMAFGAKATELEALIVAVNRQTETIEALTAVCNQLGGQLTTIGAATAYNEKAIMSLKADIERLRDHGAFLKGLHDTLLLNHRTLRGDVRRIADVFAESPVESRVGLSPMVNHSTKEENP